MTTVERSGSTPSTELIVRIGLKAYLSRHMVRLLTSLLAALALFFSPISMVSGGGMAMAHASTAAAASMEGHCSGDSGNQNEQKSDMKAGCLSACSAVPAVEPWVAGHMLPREKIAAVAHQLVVGIFPEGETPPPRNTPEI